MDSSQHVLAYEAAERKLWSSLLAYLGPSRLGSFAPSVVRDGMEGDAIVDVLVRYRTRDVWRSRLRGAANIASDDPQVHAAFREFNRAREAFIAEFSWLVFRYTDPDCLDAAQDGSLGLIRAVDTATPDVCFERYAAEWIHRYAQKLDGPDMEVFDDCSPIGEPDTTLDDVRACLRRLSEPEVDVLRLRYGLDGAPAVSTFSAIGSILGGISEDRIKAINSGALDKLRRCLL